MNVSRRHFIRTAAAFAAGFTGLRNFAALAEAPDYGYGPLIPDPAGVLDLPRGFSYRIISRSGDRMDDGLYVPHVPDGTAAFPGPDALTVLVRNHEVNLDSPAAEGAFGPSNELLSRVGSDRLYDAGSNGAPCLGGTTTIVYDTHTGRVVSRHLSLAGTLRNCAGGPTPWGTWISCEETTVRSGESRAKDHGFTFEVPATPASGLADPVPLTAMGRFNHEAVAVDPVCGIIYQTEDQSDGLIYRFLPNVPGRPVWGGRLQALAVVDRPSLDTRNWDTPAVMPGRVLDVEWLDLDDVTAPEDDLRFRGFAAGAARFARGEGMWYGNGAVYFACTSGGRERAGQIWKYVPADREGEPAVRGRLDLFIEPDNTSLVQNCDNVTVAPWGDLILCEDGPGEQFLVGVTPAGRLYHFGRNAASGSEITGATFAPDGSTLFVNLYQDGLTLAITGTWKVQGV